MNNTFFHPSNFEDPNTHTPKDERSLVSISNERGQRLSEQNFNNIVSRGAYKLTVDDKTIAKSNTGHLFKNLYGETPLTNLFFSEQNIKNLQNVIRLIVHKETGYVVDEQSNNELMIIMRSIFLEYSRHPKLLTKDMSNEEQRMLLQKYKSEVQRLNDIVINAVIPKIVSNLQQYLDYLRDASQHPYERDNANVLPKNESIAGQRQYRSVTQVLLGGDL
jgi:hypothetical protein